jgi:hypothetical protein
LNQRSGLAAAVQRQNVNVHACIHIQLVEHDGWDQKGGNLELDAIPGCR